ncbi:TetR family transcriptional regulator [Nocardiopsis eucommiae]|uniref:TetR family transcriptional regulator n=1 Tax=Nocardiopsis eucommiae TaxID=2831970 RepID=A0A975LC01_9ACTN|nr:TetR family transcriptional regulator [Nocardiopsis eucommiae]
MTPRPGLRESKKRRTRAALARAAWELLATEGLAAVTPESVAARVGVSGNTFRNYFSCREEAIIEVVIPRMESLAEGLRARPVDEPVWDSLTHVLPVEMSAMFGRHADVVVLLRATKENPTILAQHLTAIERVKRLLAEAIHERTGDDDLPSRLLAEAAGLAVRTSIEVWALGDESSSLADIVTESITQLRSGIPVGDKGQS